nr:MAG TPA: hypothetical protein [Caudoviricetes sp.]
MSESDSVLTLISTSDHSSVVIQHYSFPRFTVGSLVKLYQNNTRFSAVCKITPECEEEL